MTDGLTRTRRDLMDNLVVHPSSSFETGQTFFQKCLLCWMGGRLSIHAVVYPSNRFYIFVSKLYCDILLWLGLSGQ